MTSTPTAQTASDAPEVVAQNARTMIARFKSYCRGCNTPIARGARIAFVQGVGSFCDTCHANGCKPCDEPRSVARWSNGARSLGARVHTIRFSSGETMTQNARGRCEDAPCCGCCS